MPRLPDSFRLSFDSDGDPAPGALLYVYFAGTTTAATTYSDEARTTANAHPVVADASGAVGDVYLASGKYKVKLTDAAGVDLPGTPVDNIVLYEGEGSLTVGTVAAAAAVYQVATDVIHVEGYAAAGDGGHATYTKVDAEPSHLAKIQTADGAWFELTGRPICPRQFSDDDDAAFAAMAGYIEAKVASGDWRGSFGTSGDLIDGRGLTFTIADDVTIRASTSWDAMLLQTTGGALSLGISGATGESYGQHLRPGFDMVFTGETDMAKPLISIPRGFNTIIECNTRATNAGETAHALCAIYLGENRAWGTRIDGGRHYGGYWTIRIGNTADHTASWIGGGATIDHGIIGDLLCCNPNGLVIEGVNIEHAEGYVAIAITSDTSGSGDIARNITISGVYSFNNGNGGFSVDNCAITVGHDVTVPTAWETDPGTPGVLTSAASATNIRITNCDLVSDFVAIPIKIAAGSQIVVEDNNYEYATGYGPFVEYSGACTGARHGINRRQSGTPNTAPNYSSTATGRILADHLGTDAWTPTIESATGTLAYATSAAGGSWSVSRGVAQINGHVVANTFATGTGALTIPLPSGIAPIAGTRDSFIGHDYGFSKRLALFVAAGATAVDILESGTTAAVVVADAPAGATNAGVHFNLSFPVDLAT